MLLTCTAIHAEPLDPSVELSVEEIAFVAKLEDKNRVTFVNKLTQEQRKAVLIAVNNGASADEAVYRMWTAQEVKQGKSVVKSE